MVSLSRIDGMSLFSNIPFAMLASTGLLNWATHTSSIIVLLFKVDVDSSATPGVYDTNISSPGFTEASIISSARLSSRYF